ncbi:MAG: PhoH family protein [Nitrospirae bacterium]|nr:PhoH family protein [Nitrospirota bacterium]
MESTLLEIELDSNVSARALLGRESENLKALERLFHVRVHSRGNQLAIEGPEADSAAARRVVMLLSSLIQKGYTLMEGDLERLVEVYRARGEEGVRQIYGDEVYLTGQSLKITPRSLAQKTYVEAIRGHDVVFGIGPAGTGKTYLAMAMALSLLRSGRVHRLALTRPAIEAGERLGFLPGDILEKVNPYLRPLYDALHDMVEFEKARKMVEKGIIEVAPLAFMRGRTLNDTFVILDEAQNTTPEQMKMFLTRLGNNSKAVITGDVTQIDLPDPKRSGLIQAEQILRGVNGLAIVWFTDRDVVRHPLVQEIIRAYERHERAAAGLDRPVPTVPGEPGMASPGSTAGTAPPSPGDASREDPS